MHYTKEELNLMKGCEDSPKKLCRSCEKLFPINKTFFLVEKRQPDGFENKCRKCRKGRFLVSGDSKGRIKIDHTIITKYKSIEEQYENFINTNSLPYRSFIIDNHLKIFKYIVTKENINITELNKLNRDWFKDKRLYGALLKIYNGIIYDFINAAYPNVFNPWDFITVGSEYWKKKDNRIKAIKWLIDKLLKEKYVNSIDEIPRKVSSSTFIENGLGTLMVKYYDHVSDAINEIYPNRFYIWQYIFAPEGYYCNKQNRIKCIREFIEEYLKMDLRDIPKVLSYGYFDYNFNNDTYFNWFRNMLMNHYDSSVYKCINEVYPNMFVKKDFPYKNHYPTLDNIVVRSEPERQIHHLFMNMKLDYKYGDYVGRMTLDNKEVLPDWYIYKNDRVYIVEYYGMLEVNDIDFGYIDKYEKKEQLYKELCNCNSQYEYIALYYDDLKNSYSGLINKLNKYRLI